MNINKNQNGSVLITDIINNNWIHQTYYGYSIKQATKLFKQYIRGIK